MIERSVQRVTLDSNKFLIIPIVEKTKDEIILIESVTKPYMEIYSTYEKIEANGCSFLLNSKETLMTNGLEILSSTIIKRFSIKILIKILLYIAKIK